MVAQILSEIDKLDLPYFVLNYCKVNMYNHLDNVSGQKWL